MPDAGKESLRLDIGKPKKDGEVKVTVTFQGDGGGPKFKVEAKADIKASDTATEKAAKIAAALKAKIDALAAAQRGIGAGQAKVIFSGTHEVSLPIVIISNKAGFTLKNYKYDKGKTKEKTKTTKLAAYVPEGGREETYAAVNLAESGQIAVLQAYGEATGGGILIGFDEGPEIMVETGGQSLGAVHEAMVAAVEARDIAATLATEPADKELTGEFAGFEVRLERLDAATISLECLDDGLGLGLMVLSPESAKK
ncbi:MAG: hypothetical protein HKN30_15285 [Sulfitobacter sp.]|nr:hypothetical protein [Sulfitobacter sp.]